MGAASRVSEYVGGPGLSDKDAQLVGALITSIQRERGRLSTEELLEAVVEESRPARSPTHHLFEWDPVKGHALYLLDRARTLVMAVKVVFADAPKQEVRAFPVVISGGKKGPIAMQRVLDDKDLMAALLEQAKADLDVWRRRYERLRDLAEMRGVFAAVERVVKRKR